VPLEGVGIAKGFLRTSKHYSLHTQRKILLPLVFLALLGGLAARAGGAGLMMGATRVTFWGALAMALTTGVGSLFGAIPLPVANSHESLSHGDELQIVRSSKRNEYRQTIVGCTGQEVRVILPILLISSPRAFRNTLIKAWERFA
jgi:hypothetical protein